MQFRRKLTLYFLLYVALCGVTFAQVVDIPDSNLRDAIRQTLEIEAPAITKEDMPPSFLPQRERSKYL